MSERSGVRFGTSGLRGLVTALTPEIAGAFTRAFLDECGSSPGPVLIGHDLRPSSPAIAGTCFAQAIRLGHEPVNAGIVPTPALAFAAQMRGVPAIMVTGSHIPFDRNGIKFYLPQGEISKDDEDRILSSPIVHETAVQAALPAAEGGVAEAYAQRYSRAFGPSCLAGLTLGIFEHSSAARDLLHTILRALGATTVGLLRSDEFVPVDTEAVSAEDQELGRRLARRGFDAILTTDGDGDRPLIADEHGEWLRGDAVGVLAARAIGARTVVTPVSSSTALERSGWFSKTVRTRIGSPHVIASMESAKESPIAGYEANGGFLLGTEVTLNGNSLAALKTRDAVLPMILLLDLARKQGKSLSELAASLPRRHTFSTRLQNIEIEACRTLLVQLATGPQAFSRLGFPATALDLTDGVRASLSTGDILHLRLSGNAPELRCYAESDTAERAATLCTDGLAAVDAILKAGLG